MTPRDWFGLGVRFAGIWCALQSASSLMRFLDVRLGFSMMREFSFNPYEYNAPNGHWLYVLGYGVLALYFLLGADHLTRLSFGAPEPPPVLEEAEEEEPLPPYHERDELEDNDPHRLA